MGKTEQGCEWVSVRRARVRALRKSPASRMLVKMNDGGGKATVFIFSTCRRSRAPKINIKPRLLFQNYEIGNQIKKNCLFSFDIASIDFCGQFVS